MPLPQQHRGLGYRLYKFLFGTTPTLIAEEIRETEDLYRRVATLHEKSPTAQNGTPFDMACGVCAGFIEHVPARLTGDFLAAVRDIIALEGHLLTLPEVKDFKALSMKEGMELRNMLRSKEWFHLNEEKVVKRLYECLHLLFGTTALTIPDIEVPSPFTIPVIYTLPEPRHFIDKIWGTLAAEEYADADLFARLRKTLYANYCAASGLPQGTDKPLRLAAKSTEPLHEIVTTYLGGTPFGEFLASPVPLKLTHEDRANHVHVVGGSGAGKTQLLQTLILHDIQSEDPPALVIIDSQGDLIDKLSHLEAIQDRLLLITPKDIDHPPALNIFDIDRGRLGGYDALTKEQVTAGAIETFDYLFTGLLGADLTAKQGVFFRYVARLMLSLPETMGRNATIIDMIRLMNDTEPYRPAIEKLPDIQREFFLRDFTANTFEQTKEQIRYRLQGIIENPTIAKLFTSERTKIDLFTELNNGSIILVDTAKDLLKGSSSHFGRIFIALTLQAVLERAAIPENKRRSAFLVVDEAAEYFDQNIDDLLTEARKYKLGCCFAHQHLDQCTPQLRASFAANTGIKMASGVSSSDARALAPDMRTSQDFILSQPKLHFACHIRNVTPQAVSIPIEVGKLEREPRLSDAAYEEMRKLNRERVSLGISRAPPPDPPPAAPSPPPAPPSPTRPTGGVSFMVTAAQKEALRQRGYTDADLREMRPEDAHRTVQSPKKQRKRPKRRHGPIEDIDTSS
jgi:hypothetical protein